MPCCVMGLVAAGVPRIALLFVWLSGYGTRAFDSMLWPVLGFFFLPCTTCAYAVALNETGGVQGWGLALVVIGVLLDISSTGGAAQGGRRAAGPHGTGANGPR